MNTTTKTSGRAAFFDLDGCLVDSRGPISAAMNAALAELGLPQQNPDELHRYIGPPLLEGLQRILVSLNADPRLGAQAVAAYRRVYPDLAVRETRLVDGISDLLAELHGHVTLMVVTSKPREFAEPILDAVGIRPYFDAVFGPALAAMTEPKTTKLSQALTLAEASYGTRRTAARMIGDREHDIAAGQYCRVGTIGVTWGIGDRAELIAAGADLIVDEPHHLVPLLTSAHDM